MSLTRKPPEPHQITHSEAGLPLAPEPAKLRIYIGAAPGVGKTFQMLETAHLMRKQGIDVVIGLIETHGRSETAAMIRDLGERLAASPRNRRASARQ